jgi:hypothetical protein
MNKFILPRRKALASSLGLLAVPALIGRAFALENAKSSDAILGGFGSALNTDEKQTVHGVYHAVFRDGDGAVYHEEKFDNLLTTLGKNFLEDEALAGSSYTVVGPFMGLISSTSFSAVSASDTMASHAGWLEAGTTNAPTYAARLNVAWSAASGGTKSLSSALTFTFTGAGTVQGAFIAIGTGAVSTNLSTAGTLFSAGALGTAQPVISGNTLAMSYSVTIT